ncbi:unnamed protein product, partial [Cyprideis torosa]
MKVFHGYQAEFKSAEHKLRVAEKQRDKYEAGMPKQKLLKNRKFKLIEKEIEKDGRREDYQVRPSSTLRKEALKERYLDEKRKKPKRISFGDDVRLFLRPPTTLTRNKKFADAQYKFLKSRNDYLLSLEVANESLQKYYVVDLPDLIDCMDIGFHHSVSNSLRIHLSAEDCLRLSKGAQLDSLKQLLGAMDARKDRQRFLDSFHTTFMMPKKFEFQGPKGDDPDRLSTMDIVKDELITHFGHLHKRLGELQVNNEETWKSLEESEKRLMDMITVKDYNVSGLFLDDRVSKQIRTTLDDRVSKQIRTTLDDRFTANRNGGQETISMKIKEDRLLTEDYYLSKFSDSMSIGGIMSRLQAKYELMRTALGEEALTPSGGQLHQVFKAVEKPRRKRLWRTSLEGQPKLFGGSLEEYCEGANQEIPLVIRSCIRVINLYGLHHQGIFRISGSQLEINAFRDAFERGEDPLAEVADSSDINAVSGVLKLYLRDLREPLFPTVFFDQLMEMAQMDSKHGFVLKMRELVQTLPRCVFLVLRYLFAFLYHLSEFSDENMMDVNNLAVCFGPSLIPIPDEGDPEKKRDRVHYQNLINELVKSIILFHEDIFPRDIPGPVYEKYMSEHQPDETDVGESPLDQSHDDPDSEIYPSEDESDVLEAVAQFDFTARSKRELSFRKGDVLTLFNQVSSDWWKGSHDGKEGLIPDKYILLKIRGEDRDRSDPSSQRSASISTTGLGASTPSPSQGGMGGSSVRSVSVSQGPSSSPGQRRTSSSSDSARSHSSSRPSEARHSTSLVTADDASPIPSSPSEDSISSLDDVREVTTTATLSSPSSHHRQQSANYHYATPQPPQRMSQPPRPSTLSPTSTLSSTTLRDDAPQFSRASTASPTSLTLTLASSPSSTPSPEATTPPPVPHTASHPHPHPSPKTRTKLPHGSDATPPNASNPHHTPSNTLAGSSSPRLSATRTIPVTSGPAYLQGSPCHYSVPAGPSAVGGVQRNVERAKARAQLQSD